MQDSGNVVAAYSEEDTSRLTGVSRAQLRYWDRKGFFKPAYGSTGVSGFTRVFSFKDIVSLRVLDTLRNQFLVKDKLSRALPEIPDGDHWTRVKLYPLNGKVVWVDPKSGTPEEMLSGQYVVPVVIDLIIADTRDRVIELNKRDVSMQGQIERVRNISRNAPVFAGTRIPVAAIKRYLEAGYAADHIIAEYPDLTIADINAAAAYDFRSAA
jgi:uncharacterized protein (DUF433 family)